VNTFQDALDNLIIFSSLAVKIESPLLEISAT
jgi:hypothetical protein